MRMRHSPVRGVVVRSSVPVVLVMAGCAYDNPHREVDDAVADAFKSEPMWTSYRPTWVESESTMRIPRGQDMPGVHHEMVSDRFLHGNPLRTGNGITPVDPVPAAQAAATQYGWSSPTADADAYKVQYRPTRGNGRPVTLSLEIGLAEMAVVLIFRGSVR